MANKRIKDISTTATSPASDDFVVLDSSSQGTRKIDAGPLGGVFDETIKTGSGTFPVAALAGIQIANGASSYSYFSATDDTKQFAAGIDHTLTEGTVGMISNHGLRVVTNNTERLRVDGSTGDVGIGVSDPNGYKLNVNGTGYFSGAVAAPDVVVIGATPTLTLYDTGGDANAATAWVAFQQGDTGIGKVGDLAEGRSAMMLWADSGKELMLFSNGQNATSDTPALRIDTSQNVGIGGSLEFNSGADLKIFHDGSNGYCQNVTGDFSLKNASAEYLKGLIATGAVELFHNGTKQCETSATGLSFPDGKGIDFSNSATSAGGGTGTTGTSPNSVFSDYEYGGWVPTFKTNGTNFTTMTMDVVSASYVKFGRQVMCQAMVRTTSVDATAASGDVVIDGLPFVSDSATDSHGTAIVGQANNWVNMPTTGFTVTNAAEVRLMRSGGAGFTTSLVASDFTSGATPYQNAIMISISYIATT